MTMKKGYILLVLMTFLISCKKDNAYLFPEYETITGTWTLQSISYDSSGVNITKAIPYDRLVIDKNLEYKIFMNQSNPVENGNVKIITQTSDDLVLYFSAQYPAYSSFAGSHIFGFSNVELVSLSNHEMIIKTINAAYAEYSDQELTFVR